MTYEEEAEYSAWLDLVEAARDREEAEQEQRRHEGICVALAISREVA